MFTTRWCNWPVWKLLGFVINNGVPLAVLAAMERVRSRVLVYTSSRLDLMLAERILKLTYLNAGSSRFKLGYHSTPT